MTTTTPVIKLVNETALGVYVFSWTSPSSKGRCVVSWFDGLDVPAFEFWSPTRGGMIPPVPVRDPARFAPWPPRQPSRKALADFKAWAAAFAAACETPEEEA